jgi:hypothetical protein
MADAVAAIRFRPGEDLSRIARWAAGRPLVVRGGALSLLCDGCVPTASASLLDLRHLQALESIDGPVEVSLRRKLLYYSPGKPLANVRGFEVSTRTSRQLHGMSGSALLGRIATSTARSRWDPAWDDRWPNDPSGTCAPAKWVAYSASNGSNAAALAATRLRTAGLAEAAGALACGTVIGCGGDADAQCGWSHHSTNLWAGGGGVTSWCHYDASASAFAQLHGTKTFLLAHPNASRQLRPHSFLSPHFRRSQRDPTEALPQGEMSGAGDRPGPSSVPQPPPDHAPPPRPLQSTAAPPLLFSEARLSPGDVLLLPAFWWHHVSAPSSLSLSLNAWAVSHHTRRAQAAVAFIAHKLGLHSHAISSSRSQQLHVPGAAPEAPTGRGAAQRAAALAELASSHLASATLGIALPEARRAIAAEMRSRWAPISQQYPRGMAKLVRFCDPAGAGTRAALAASALPADGAAGLVARLSNVAETVGMLHDGAREIELFNAIESLAMQMLGGAKEAGSFLTLCFRE